MKRRSNSNAISTLGLALAAALPCLAVSTAANAAPPAENDTNARAEESRRYTARGRGDRRDKWIHRWAPVRNMWEFGIYGGVWFPSKHLELFGPTESGSGAGNQRLNTVAPDVGLRAAYFPLRFLGVEIEGGVMPTKTKSSDVSATAWALRGHVIGQLGLWSVTPFILAGAGLVGMDSASPPRGIGKDQDVAIHFGAGVKVFINRWVMLRLDVRDVVSNRAGVGEGLTSSPEILLGLSFTLRSKKKKKSRPRDDDRDGDRVLDKDDFCVDVYGPPPRGCPQVCIDDNDGDGLDNTEDSCIDDPETRNGFEDGDGCPDEVPPELSEIAGIMEGIHFDTDKDNIKATSKPNIDNAAAVMKKYPSIRVRVVGHTDSQGAYKHNIDLSQRRAASVKRAMVEQGVEDSRIETAGVGPDQPIDTNETAEGRAKNRRIEFLILEGTASKTVKPRGKKPPKDEPPVEPTPEPTPEPAADAAKPAEPTAPN